MEDIINPKVDLTPSEDLQNEQDELIKGLQGTIQSACDAYWRMSDAFRGAVRSARTHKASIETAHQMYARLAKRYREAQATIAKQREEHQVDAMLLTQRQTEINDLNAKLDAAQRGNAVRDANAASLDKALLDTRRELREVTGSAIPVHMQELNELRDDNKAIRAQLDALMGVMREFDYAALTEDGKREDPAAWLRRRLSNIGKPVTGEVKKAAS